MKKILAILLSAAAVISFTACSNSTQSSTQPTTNSVSTSDTAVKNEVETDKIDWVDFKEYKLDSTKKPKNVILMIGDGMGENIIKASEIVKGDKLIMSGLPYKTHVTTYSQSVTDRLSNFTDSAASATALSTGVKTYNKYIGVDKDGNEVETICEFAKKYGMKTGLVDRHYVCHATPAGMAAHNESRDNYPAILRSMLNNDVDVILGGGSQYYDASKKVQNTVEKNGYTYIKDEESLLNFDDKNGKLLGMFAYDNMKNAYMKPTLTTMTAKALDLLDNEDGFFLMVEGSNIDVCESLEDMDGTIQQMQAFDHTVDYVLNWVESHPDTLVIVTADHETGGVKIPENATANDIDNSCFTSGGDHTNTNVLVMTGGADSENLCKDDLIDNTDIAKYMRTAIKSCHTESK